MEIRNNLISRTDITSVSKTKKVHQLRIKQYPSYKIIANTINKSNTPTDEGFINMVTNARFVLSEEELLLLSDKTMSYTMEFNANNQSKMSTVFMPIAEMVNERSNPKVLIEIENGLKYTSSSDYELIFGMSNMLTITTSYFSIIRELTGIPESMKLTMVVSYRPGVGRSVILKLQILELLLTKSAIKFSADELAHELRRSKVKVYMEKYDEWFMTNVNPTDKKWIHYDILSNTPNSMSSGSSTSISYDYFASTYKKLPLVFSVNRHEESSFEKKIWNTGVDNEPFPEEDDNSAILQLFIDHPKAKYYDILLRHLPEEYKTDYDSWRSLIKTFRHTMFKLLFEEFSRDTEFFAEFEREWKYADSIERVPMGYFHQLCKKNPEFDKELQAFLVEYVETLCYIYDFDIIEKDACDVIRMLSHGQFYTTHNKIKNTWWLFINDGMDCTKGEIYKWRSAEPMKFLPSIIHGKYFEIIGEVKNKIDLSMDDSKEKTVVMKKIKSYEKQVGKGAFIANVMKVLDSSVDLPWLYTRMDKYADVLGVENGVVELNVGRSRGVPPIPKLITGYSKYFITKSTRAQYKEFDKNNQYCRVWKNIFREIIPEKDARRAITYILSTGCDQACKMIYVTQLRGGGSNGKSVLIDNIMYVLGPENATKLSSGLLLDKVKGGSADNDLMLMEGKNIGFICETDEGDTIVSSRLKTINEEFKTGRKNYQDQKNFEANCTVVIATNNALELNDTDYGSSRRLINYEMPIKFCAKPNPKYPNEKKSNKAYETLAKDNPDAADALLSYLIHKRVRFHQLYKSDIEQVDMPTIVHYTDKYKREQNKMYNFLCQRIVLLKGYQPDGELRDDHTADDVEKYYMENDIDFSHSIDLDRLVDEYRKWFETVGKIGAKSNDSIKREFLESKIKNNIKPIDDGRYYMIPGYRVLQGNKKKLPEEGYFI